MSQQIQLQTRMYAITNVEKSEIGIEVMLMDNNKLVGKQVIPNERLQNRLLKFMEQFLNDDHIDYDHK